MLKKRVKTQMQFMKIRIASLDKYLWSCLFFAISLYILCFTVRDLYPTV